MEREVRSRIELDVTETADLVLSVAVSAHYEPDHETFAATLDGARIATSEFQDHNGTRLHRVSVPPGTFVAEYHARILGEGAHTIGRDYDLFSYRLPSRYVESDTLAPTALAEFDGIDDEVDLLAAVSSWVGTRLDYVPGASRPTDGAVRTLLGRQGVCRDYAHLCIALLRARGVAARFASVYAPGLAPMEFHAVAEAWVDGAWRVVDATALAPRQTLLRIATGRDAADTAFLTVLSGRADLTSIEVTAVADALPADDVTELVSIR
ncbi:transglutaminase-like domain-containing protein [Microbacterium telephonicum]|uniref:Transglutaminase-like putative cysteine protease n=1 Tax=Microbacterium telephonicum TaxID=1714841 RepID=A0A498BY75_9MICO|nr:transglutaminase family protein [Microbacterium telephonicum]RLK47829.1 transglutaminase-like putative cysteine protease [Microbacterium telephonicum]